MGEFFWFLFPFGSHINTRECVSVLFTITNPKHAILPANEQYRLKADVC